MCGHKWLWLGCVLAAQGVAAESLLLTGEITSAQSQVVTAPKTDRWQVMIQWLPEEGQMVQAGELVAVFDAGGIQSQLDQNQQQLAMQQLELKKIEMDLQQAVVEAEGRLTLAKLAVKKARIESEVQDGDVSAFEKGKYQIAYEKALLEQIKAEENLKLRQQERDVGIDKQRIKILQTEEDILYQTSQLDKMSVKAQVSGPVSHMPHPWNPENKIAAGTNVQASWNVLTVQAQQGYQVTAWLHEIDAIRVDPAHSQISLSLDAYPGTLYSGHILSLAKQAESRGQWGDSAYYKVVIGFDTPPPVSLSPGMSVRVHLDPSATGGQS